MAVAVNAARSRNGAGVSEVATTTTERRMPSGPRSFSTNSLTSRPRSPTNPTTTTSAAAPRAIMPSSVDLPTPDPANRPRRWPRPTGMNVSIARTPVCKALLMRSRRSGCGGVLFGVAFRETGSRPRPSNGRPKASSTRPSNSGPGRGSGGRSAAATSQPTCNPAVSPNGINNTRCSRKPTTSARRLKLVRGDRNRHSSPKPTFGPSDSMMSPATPVTAPTRCTDGRCRTCVRRTSIIGATAGVMARNGRQPAVGPAPRRNRRFQCPNNGGPLRRADRHLRPEVRPTRPRPVGLGSRRK